MFFTHAYIYIYIYKLKKGEVEYIQKWEEVHAMHATLHVQASACTPWGNRASYVTQELKNTRGGKRGGEDRRKEQEEKKEESNGGCSWPVENFRRMKNPTRRRSACRFPRNRLTGAPNSERKQEKGKPPRIQP